MATDAFTIAWTGLKAYANPPWSLVGRVLAQVRQQKANLILVAPVWKTQTWYPALLGLPMADSPQEGPNSTSTSTGNAGCVTPTSRVEYLRG